VLFFLSRAKCFFATIDFLEDRDEKSRQGCTSGEGSTIEPSEESSKRMTVNLHLVLREHIKGEIFVE